MVRFQLYDRLCRLGMPDPTKNPFLYDGLRRVIAGTDYVLIRRLKPDSDEAGCKQVFVRFVPKPKTK